MNAKDYAQKMFFQFQQFTVDDINAIECCYLCLDFIRYESESRFIDFWNNVKIELELIHKKLK